MQFFFRAKMWNSKLSIANGWGGVKIVLPRSICRGEKFRDNDLISKE